MINLGVANTVLRKKVEPKETGSQVLKKPRAKGGRNCGEAWNIKQSKVT